jgi:dihydroxyacetone kinase DhaKLM complex PTS-EIIA-like component DhaM
MFWRRTQGKPTAMLTCRADHAGNRVGEDWAGKVDCIITEIGSAKAQLKAVVETVDKKLTEQGIARVKEVEGTAGTLANLVKNFEELDGRTGAKIEALKENMEGRLKNIEEKLETLVGLLSPPKL